MKQEGDAIRCHPVNSTSTRKRQLKTSTIMDFDKQRRTLVTKIDDFVSELFQSLRDFRELVSRSSTNSGQLLQAEVILEQLKQNRDALDNYITISRRKFESVFGAKQNLLSLKPTFVPKITLNPILEEHNLKQHQQLQKPLLNQAQSVAPALGTSSDNDMAPSFKESSESRLFNSSLTLDSNIVPLDFSPQPIPQSSTPAPSPMMTSTLRTQNEKDAYEILHRIGEHFFINLNSISDFIFSEKSQQIHIREYKKQNE